MAIAYKWTNLNQQNLYDLTRPVNHIDAISMGDDDRFHGNSAAYAWNNEPAYALTNLIGRQHEKGLTVAASGDQNFIFIQSGARKLLSFDISQIACFWNELKHSMILELSYAEFRFFTLGEGSIPLGISSLFTRLSKHLTVEARDFFIKLMDHSNHIYHLLHESQYFRGNQFGFKAETVPYASSEQAYYQLKKIRSDVIYRHVWMDLSDTINQVSGECFDFIFISNILDRWHLFGGDYLDILDKLMNLLEPHGILIGNYQVGGPEFISLAAKQMKVEYQPHSKEHSDYWTMKWPK